MTEELGRLLPIDVRSVWKHEAHDFTRWMLSAADVLGEALGMELELTEAEHRVGGFSLDLIGKDVATNGAVIIENQLEQTDHGHLGQLLTYAGGTDPRTIVWCAQSFRDEHRAALDWLNENTLEHVRFFGVEIAAVRIDQSRPAPLFRVVAKPNDWSKKVHVDTARALSEKTAAYREFWGMLLQRVRRDHPMWTSSKNPPAASWITLPFGTSTIYYSLAFTQNGPRVELYFGSSVEEENTERFQRYHSQREPLEAEFGAGAVDYDPIPGKKACRISVRRVQGGDVLDEDRDVLLDWFIDTFDRFRRATLQIKATVDRAAP